jgi:MFS family permease
MKRMTNTETAAVYLGALLIAGLLAYSIAASFGWQYLFSLIGSVALVFGIAVFSLPKVARWAAVMLLVHADAVDSYLEKEVEAYRRYEREILRRGEE